METTPCSAGTVAPRLTIDGEAIAPPLFRPARRDGEWFIPLEPVASALAVDLYYDPQALTIHVTDPLRGRSSRYEVSTGNVWRDELLEVVLSPDLLEGAALADLQAPVSLVALLFDLEVFISPDASEIVLTSRERGSISELQEISPVRLQEVRYRGQSWLTGSSRSGAFSVSSRARVTSGRMETSADFRMRSGEPVRLRSAQVGYWDGGANTWTAGDLRSAGRASWLRGVGRGGRWDGQFDGGRHRLSLSALRLLVATPEGGRPVFDGDMVAASYAVGARPGAPLGGSLGFGAAWMGRVVGTESTQGSVPLSPADAGLLTFGEFAWSGPRARFTGVGGSFLPRDVGDASVSASNSADVTDVRESPSVAAGYELGASLTPWRALELSWKGTDLPGGLRLPSRNVVTSSTRSQTVGISVRPVGWLALRGTGGRQYTEDVSSTKSSYATGHLNLVVPRGPVRAVEWMVSRSFHDGHARPTDYGVSGRGAFLDHSWFAKARRRELESERTNFATAGWGRRFDSVGSFQLTGGWTDWSFESASIHWGLPALFGRTLSITTGAQYEARSLLNGREAWSGHVRVSWSPFDQHQVRASFDSRRSANATQVAVDGGWLFPEGELDRRLGGVGVPVRHVADLEGRVYLDRNVNGEFDEGDHPLSGVVVLLDGGKQRRTTEADGRYSFRAISAGDHSVALHGRTLRADWSVLGESKVSVSIPALRTRVQDFRTGVNRTLRGVVFVDQDGDGERDATEPAVPDAHVVVVGRHDTVAGYDGRYVLGDLPPGRYTVVVDAGSLPEVLETPVPVQVLVPASDDPVPLDLPVSVRAPEVIRRVFPGVD